MLVDASPLIYLAKIDALDVFEAAGHVPLITTEVERETSRPGLAYEYPDSVLIREALKAGLLRRVELSQPERIAANRLWAETGGLDTGESEVLAAALERRLPVLLHERRATKMASSMGIDSWTVIRILFAGTSDSLLLIERLRRFAALVAMRFEDVQRLIDTIEERER